MNGEYSLRSVIVVSVKVKCPDCGWNFEYDDDTRVGDLLTTCPQCQCELVIVGIAHWMRNVPEYAI